MRHAIPTVLLFLVFSTPRHVCEALELGSGGEDATGKITAIGKSDPRLCEINLGSDDGVQVGDEFAIVDPRGKKTLGLLIVTAIGRNACVAEGNGLKLGSAVVTTGRKSQPRTARTLNSEQASKSVAQGIDIYYPVGKVLEIREKQWLITGVINSMQPKGIRQLGAIDINFAKKTQSGNWERTESPCVDCNWEGLIKTRRSASCSTCKGVGFVRGSGAMNQLLRKNTVFFPAEVIGGLEFPSGEQLDFDPFHRILTDPVTARRGHQLLAEKNQKEKQERATKAVAQEAIAQLNRERANNSRVAPGLPVPSTADQRQLDEYNKFWEDRRNNDGVLNGLVGLAKFASSDTGKKLGSWYMDRVRATPSSSPDEPISGWVSYRCSCKAIYSCGPGCYSGWRTEYVRLSR